MGSPFYDQFRAPHGSEHQHNFTQPEGMPGAHKDQDVLEQIKFQLNEALQHMQQGDIIKARDILEDMQMELESSA